MIIIVIIVAGVAMVLANYMWQRERNRREEEHERRVDRYNRLLQFLKKPNSDQDVQESDTTEVEEDTKS
jgi:Flp pilus assembly protein TadB